MKKNQILEPVNLNITYTGVLLEDSIKHRDKLKEVNTTIMADFDIAPIVRNSKGELFMQLVGKYYPLTFGEWIQKEKVTFVEDAEEENVEYNCMMEVEGIHYLFAIEPVNSWEGVDFESDEIIAKNETEKNAIRALKEKLAGNTDYELHLDSVPEPFWGDIVNANVFILSGNPGYGDPKIEKSFIGNTDLIQKTHDNLEQTSPTNLNSPNLLWLEPNRLIQNAGDPHPGYDFWQQMTSDILNVKPNPNICVIEFFPYHSKKISGEMKKCAMTLPSSLFVDYYIEKAIKEGKWIVIARCKSEWLNRIDGKWLGYKLRDYKNTSNKVLVTKGQKMNLTRTNLQKAVDMDSNLSPAGAPKWIDFLSDC